MGTIGWGHREGPELSREFGAGVHTSDRRASTVPSAVARAATERRGGNADPEGPRPDWAQCFGATETRVKGTRNGWPERQETRRRKGEWEGTYFMKVKGADAAEASRRRRR